MNIIAIAFIIFHLVNDMACVQTKPSPYNYKKYQPFRKIEQELHRIARKSNIANKFNNRRITLFSIGKTFEGQNLWAMEFQHATNTSKKSIVIDCGAHAREWVAPSTCMYLIFQLSQVMLNTKSSQKHTFLPMLTKFNWVIIPLLNPDGYAYTWHNETTRLWRKNRSYTKKQLKMSQKKNNDMCIGVDVNRNFDKVWGGVNAPTKDPCNEMYAGDHAFSENESLSLANYISSIRKRVIAYVTLHCFGQSWMTPWGFTKKHPKDYPEMERVATLAVRAMKKFHYDVGTSYKELYPNSGTSTDYVYSKLKIPYSYLVEMIPVNGTSAPFVVPSSLMVQNAKEISIGLMTMAKNLKA